eukprot:6463781-Amphidinium_carterae.2
MHVRPRLPDPEPELVVAESAKAAVFLAAPFVIGPHQRVVEHETMPFVSIVRGMSACIPLRSKQLQTDLKDFAYFLDYRPTYNFS